MSWLRPLAAVLLVVNGLCAAGWLIWGPRDDCAAVQKLGRQWALMTAEFNDSVDGSLSDDTPSVEALAELEFAMSDRLRAAAASVSSSAIAAELTAWADSAALNAEIQRDPPPDAAPADPWPPQDTMVKLQRAAVMYRDATVALEQRCPGLKQALHTA